MVCDVDKLKKIGFFDEDYFLYWEDIDLIKKINESNFKMVLANNIFAKHDSSQSSEQNFKTNYLRNSNYVYGEFVYDFKNKKLKIVKISRKLLQNFLLLFINLLSLNFKNSLLRIYILIGILKFILYYIRVIIFK